MSQGAPTPGRHRHLLVAVLVMQAVVSLILLLIFGQRVKRIGTGSDATPRVLMDGLPPQSLRAEDITRYWVDTDARAANRSVSDMRRAVLGHLVSDSFQWPPESAPLRGIVIPAGGRKYLPMALLAIRALRLHHNCTLPIQLVWCGPEEMDDGMFRFLREQFSPLLGFDACALPASLTPRHWVGRPSAGFPLKVYALLAAPFRQALLLDSDVVPAGCPDHLFDSPEFVATGNMFWGDIYSEGMFNDRVYGQLGLQPQVADLVAGGKGAFARYAESGAVLVDRSRHLDMLEWAWWLNAMADDLTYKYMYGDKDTFGIAFALAGKPTAYYQVPVPPAGVFTHASNLGWTGDAGQMARQGGWWMNALVHFAPDGTALWTHRVTGEVYLDRPLPRDEVMTPPMPISWTMYHMSFAPRDTSAAYPALVVLPYNLTWLEAVSAAVPTTAGAAAVATAPHGALAWTLGSFGVSLRGGRRSPAAPAAPACPTLVWAAYWHMRTHAVPVPRNATLEALCCSGEHGCGGGSEGGGGAACCWGPSMRPHQLGINAAWEERTHGPYSGWGVPRQPLWAVPLNATSLWVTWSSMNDTYHWARSRPELKSLL